MTPNEFFQLDPNYTYEFVLYTGIVYTGYIHYGTMKEGHYIIPKNKIREFNAFQGSFAEKAAQGLAIPINIELIENWKILPR